MSERYQMRDCRTEIEKVYDETYWNIERIILKSDINDNYYTAIKIDLATMLYVIADYIAYNSHNRDIITNELLPYIMFRNYDDNSWSDSNYEKNRIDFKPRIKFYTKIIDKSIKPKGVCLDYDIPVEIKKNPFLLCPIAFCDILKNPFLIFGYNTNSAFSKINLGRQDFIPTVVLPIIDIVLKFVGDVMKICKEEQKQEKETQPKTYTWICYKCRNEISSYPCKYCSEQELEKCDTINPQKTHLKIFDKICEWFKILTHL